ncbi:MAG: hypothetical protein FJW23_14875 [Acidimicrobiia bacterium]|nr:hypothetical protein [Acidimicrobiia bacterium]
MSDVATELFTVGVFKDAVWAERGLLALRAAGFTPDALSFLARDGADVASLGERIFGAAVPMLDVRGLGTVRARGPIVEALQGRDAALAQQGLAVTARRLGFQAHDGRIFETLIERGGILAAVTSDERAADALGILHSYGAGNAAIGAWSGRV